MKASGSTLKPNESFGETHGVTKTYIKIYFPQALRKLISYTGSKSNKKVTLKTQETYFLRKTSKQLLYQENRVNH